MDIFKPHILQSLWDNQEKASAEGADEWTDHWKSSGSNNSA